MLSLFCVFFLPRGLLLVGHTILPSGLFIPCGWSWHQGFFLSRVCNWRYSATKKPSLNQSIVYLSTENKVYDGTKAFQNNTNSVNICLFYINSLRCYSLLSRLVLFGHPQEIIEHQSGFLLLNNHYRTLETVLFYNCCSPVDFQVSSSILHKHLLSATLKQLEKSSLDWVLSPSVLFLIFISLPCLCYPLRK